MHPSESRCRPGILACMMGVFLAFAGRELDDAGYLRFVSTRTSLSKYMLVFYDNSTTENSDSPEPSLLESWP
jgi:hypothetical protein